MEMYGLRERWHGLGKKRIMPDVKGFFFFLASYDVARKVIWKAGPKGARLRK